MTCSNSLKRRFPPAFPSSTSKKLRPPQTWVDSVYLPYATNLSRKSEFPNEPAEFRQVHRILVRRSEKGTPQFVMEVTISAFHRYDCMSIFTWIRSHQSQGYRRSRSLRVRAARVVDCSNQGSRAMVSENRKRFFRCRATPRGQAQGSRHQRCGSASLQQRCAHRPLDALATD